MVKKKEQWDYVGNIRKGIYETMIKNPLFAKFVNPFTEEIKLIRIEEGY